MRAIKFKLSLFLLLTLSMIVLFFNINEAYAPLYESYTTGDDDSFGSYTPFWLAQTWTTNNSYYIEDVSVRLFKTGTPGTVTVSIRATSGGIPTGADLTSGTLDGNSVNATSPGQWYNATMTAYRLQNNTQYAIVLRAAAGIIQWRRDSTSATYTGGIAYRSNDAGGSWVAYSTSDFMFAIYGNQYSFTFVGLMKEDQGTLYAPAERATTVVAHYQGAINDTFTVNGTYVYTSSNIPLYFSFANDREYWISSTETYNTTIYIFNTTLTTYTISFLDLAGALDEHPYVAAYRYINGSLEIMEKRKVDQDKKIQMYLQNGKRYTLTVSDGASYTFGDMLMTGTTSFQLTLKGIEFPSNIVLAYKYVRMYADRHNNQTSISLIYQDLTSLTSQVINTIYYQNGSVAYTNTQTSVNTFNVTWTSAWYNTSYYAVMTATHQTYGELTYRTVLPRAYSTAPWGLDFMGSLPFGMATSALIPLFIVLCTMGVFSQRNAYVGMFLGICITGLFVWIGWLPVASFPWSMIFTALIFTIFYALGRKRRPYLAE